ncbi:MAG TPA: LURP-one-related family protein [Actinomycetota bacterium]
MFRRRAHDQPEEAPAGTRYLLREKLLSFGDDFWIENDRGERIFKVDDKVLRARDTVIIKNADGDELLKLQKRLLRARDTMAIERGNDKVATVKKALVTPMRDRFTVELEGGGELEVEGNLLDHEYQITRDGIPVANISKRWFRVRDSYGVAVAPGQDDALVLAVTVCIDHLTDHDR